MLLYLQSDRFRTRWSDDTCRPCELCLYLFPTVCLRSLPGLLPSSRSTSTVTSMAALLALAALSRIRQQILAQEEGNNAVLFTPVMQPKLILPLLLVFQLVEFIAIEAAALLHESHLFRHPHDHIHQTSTKNGNFTHTSDRLHHRHSSQKLTEPEASGWPSARLWRLQVCGIPHMHEKLQMLGAKEFSVPRTATHPLPGGTSRTSAGDLLDSAHPSPSRSIGIHDKEMHSRGGAAVSVDALGIGRTPQVQCPECPCDVQGNNHIQVTKVLIEHRYVADECPSNKRSWWLPYCTWLSTPLEAPPLASVPPPPEPGSPEAEAFEAALRKPDFQGPLRKPQVHRKRDRCSERDQIQPRNTRSGHDRLDANVVCSLQQIVQHAKALADKSLGSALAATAKLRQLALTTQQLSFDSAPAGIRYRPGGQVSRGGRVSGASAPPSTSTSRVHKSHTNTGARRPSESEAYSDNDEQERPAPHPRKTTSLMPPDDGPDYRCPLQAAKPDTIHRRKCKEWHNKSIAAVTRHLLGDFEKGAIQREHIKGLSSDKLAPQERWKRYFIICNDGTESPHMDQPFWTTPGLEVQVQDFLGQLGALKEISFERIEEYRGMMANKELRDKGIKTRCELAKASANARELEELEQSETKHRADVANFIAGLPHDRASQAAGKRRLDGPLADADPCKDQDFQDMMDFTTPMHRRGSTGTTDSEMITQLVTSSSGATANARILTVPPDAPFPHHMHDPNADGRMDNSGGAQPLTQFIYEKERVINPSTDPTTRQSMQTQQNQQQQQTQMLHPDRSHAQLSADSGLGTSRRSVTETISSQNSHQLVWTRNYKDSSNLQGNSHNVYTPGGSFDTFMGCDEDYSGMEWMDHGNSNSVLDRTE